VHCCIQLQTVALGLVPPGTALDPVDALLRRSGVGKLVTGLALCAISTTVVGSYLALSQFVQDALRSVQRSSSESITQPIAEPLADPRGASPAVVALTVLPSLLLAATR
jgi:putative effector of murein hydrolase